jgi:transposase
MSTKLSYGWIKKGKDKAINTNGSRSRVNICGAINMRNMDVIAKEYDKSINGETITDFLQKVANHYQNEKEIYIICDQAGYHKGTEVKDFLKHNSQIKLRYLPTYSPNLNPIERLWKVMNEKARNNQYFATKKEFRTTILNFFENTVHEIKDELFSRITDNFQVLEKKKC